MPVKVFFNNSCNICKLEIDHYKKISDENLEWVDITNNQQAVDLTSKSKEELLRRLHVIDNGQVIGCTLFKWFRASSGLIFLLLTNQAIQIKGDLSIDA